MLALTENATEAIGGILNAPTVPDEAGLRIAAVTEATDDTRGTGLDVTLVEAPADGDQVIDERGARVFVDEPIADRPRRQAPGCHGQRSAGHVQHRRTSAMSTAETPRTPPEPSEPEKAPLDPEAPELPEEAPELPEEAPELPEQEPPQPSEPPRTPEEEPLTVP